MDKEKGSKRIADFFRTEYSKMVHFVSGLIDDAADRDVEDVVQDVMLNIFDSADVTRPVTNLSGYIYRSLRNRVIDLIRARKFEESLDAVGDDNVSLADVLYDARYDTVSDFERNEIRGEIFNALDELEEDERVIIFLTEFEGRSFREVSERTGVPVGTLLSKKSRAIRKVKSKLTSLVQENMEV